MEITDTIFITSWYGMMQSFSIVLNRGPLALKARTLPLGYRSAA